MGADGPTLERVERDLVESVEVDQIVELAAEGEKVSQGRELLGLLEAAEREADENELAIGEGGDGSEAFAQPLRPFDPK